MRPNNHPSGVRSVVRTENAIDNTGRSLSHNQRYLFTEQLEVISEFIALERADASDVLEKLTFNNKPG